MVLIWFELFNCYYLAQLLSEYKVTYEIIQVTILLYEFSLNIVQARDGKYAFIKITQNTYK